MQKKLISISAASLLAACLCAPAQAQNAAIVNGKPIPQQRLDALTQQIELQAQRMGQPVPENVKDQLREELISREVFAQEAKRLGLQKSPDYQAKADLALQSVLVTELFADYQDKHPITDKEAREEYDRIMASQKPAAGAKEYKASHILVENEDEAKDIIQQIKDGGDFEAIAKDKSIDPGSGANGGDLGWSDPANYVPEFADALGKLDKGKMTQEPVQSQFGWHVIRVNDIRDAKTPDLPEFEQVKPQVIQQLEQQKLQQYQQELRSKAKVE